jgi:uncharacterized protein YbaR (Trm112 family)
MSGEAAARPVAMATRTLFPQTSAHQALYGPRDRLEVRMIDKVPVLLAAHLRGDRPSPASENLQGKLAVKSDKGISRARCSWDLIFSWWTRGERDSGFRRTDEG